LFTRIARFLCLLYYFYQVATFCFIAYFLFLNYFLVHFWEFLQVFVFFLTFNPRNFMF
jgi:hypothetical protein